MSHAYEGVRVPPEEIQRLRTFAYPNQVTFSMLDRFNIAGKKVLDVGAGSSHALASYCSSMQAQYVALDINRDMVRALSAGIRSSGLDYPVELGDIRHLPFASKSVDIVHVRFVLMHLPTEDWGQAISECVRVAREGVIFAEYDWHPMFQGPNVDVMVKFLAGMARLASMLDVKLFMGAMLPSIVRGAIGEADYVMTAGKRERDNYVGELIGLTRMAVGMSVQHGFSSLECLFREVEASLDPQGAGPRFIPADIVGATVFLA